MSSRPPSCTTALLIVLSFAAIAAWVEVSESGPAWMRFVPRLLVFVLAATFAVSACADAIYRTRSNHLRIRRRNAPIKKRLAIHVLALAPAIFSFALIIPLAVNLLARRQSSDGFLTLLLLMFVPHWLQERAEPKIQQLIQSMQPSAEESQNDGSPGVSGGR